jgi:succinyl-diaminopimelate desuccinylase
MIEAAYRALDDWIEAQFEDEVRFLQALVRHPTDTPPGNNAPHAELTARLLAQMGLVAEQHPVDATLVQAQGLQSITNLVLRQRFSAQGPVLALNAHGDVVPPGEGWQFKPYGGQVVDGKLYGRASAVSKSDFATYTFALRAVMAVAQVQGLALHGGVELHFTYDEEFGGELGPGWLLAQGLTKPDWVMAAGFSHQVVTAHNGCLQMEVTLHGLASHAAYPHAGVDALQAANRLLSALYGHNTELRTRRSTVTGITHPYLNVGTIAGGSNTNVVPGKVVIKLDRRMIPEEDVHAVEAKLRALIEDTVAESSGVRLEIRRLLMAHPLKPLAGNAPLVAALQKHGQAVFGQVPPTTGTPLYTDVRLYCERGIPAVIYGAGPRTVLESNAKRADEHVQLSDLQGATRVVARSVLDLLWPAH